ncbi:hypothetical protein [Rivularia sp. UHCC 0363]|uniref:hypothetical protein n=1 Tax=Rivularia sp. UHCC 0363 TaxID=3110244 RepID=UPI002B1EF788|nr:hypothetical protein [Rivularia sp. UHCC 0363]MEA5597432.1 hypothetical protein [Rivularia sp. UHCC 0363]
MQSPSLELALSGQIYISGDVVVHPSAAIASDVLLQADPGCCLTIAAGVCIGQGAVLHACGGNLTVELGTTLGRAVLLLGRGQIGPDACIGACSTVWNCSIAAGEILPPNSLMGDIGRRVVLEASAPAVPPAEADLAADPWATDPLPEPAPDFKTGFISGFRSGFSSNGAKPATPPAAPPATPPLETAQNSTHLPAPIAKPPAQVYGQAYVERIMIAMFPHRQLLQKPTDDSSPPNPP